MEVTNLVGIKSGFPTSETEAEECETISYAVERWKSAVENHFPKKLTIVERAAILTHNDIASLEGADTLTLVTPRVDRTTAHILDFFIVDQRFRSIQVLCMIPPPANLPQVGRKLKIEKGMFVIDPTEGLTKQKIHYDMITSVRDYEALIDSLVQPV